jgi:hypothetical protein
MNVTPQRADEASLPWHASPSIALASPDDADELRLVRAMISLLSAARPTSDAEALKFLRHAFPESPLAMRIVAFAARFKREADERNYRPK